MERMTKSKKIFSLVHNLDIFVRENGCSGKSEVNQAGKNSATLKYRGFAMRMKYSKGSRENKAKQNKHSYKLGPFVDFMAE